MKGKDSLGMREITHTYANTRDLTRFDRYACILESRVFDIMSESRTSSSSSVSNNEYLYNLWYSGHFDKLLLGLINLCARKLIAGLLRSKIQAILELHRREMGKGRRVSYGQRKYN
ncbi:hypothetical protein JHK86_011848 [Glycine max]|nr:hypothetical protein JHK86_011848 [Glycine max]